jgi:hypothetical protein|tara:strand:- start:5010 stop:5420 length:411 start_codon:yes stop_codon:yes gene_type:complete
MAKLKIKYAGLISFFLIFGCSEIDSDVDKVCLLLSKVSMATNSLIKASQNSETEERAKNVLNIKNALRDIKLNTWLDIEKIAGKYKEGEFKKRLEKKCEASLREITKLLFEEINRVGLTENTVGPLKLRKDTPSDL